GRCSDAHRSNYRGRHFAGQHMYRGDGWCRLACRGRLPRVRRAHGGERIYLLRPKPPRPERFRSSIALETGPVSYHPRKWDRDGVSERVLEQRTRGYLRGRDYGRTAVYLTRSIRRWHWPPDVHKTDFERLNRRKDRHLSRHAAHRSPG